jgi:hypothetical protein
MSALAPILQGFFTDKLARQRQASPHHRRLPGHLQAAAGLRLPAGAKAALPAGHR